MAGVSLVSGGRSGGTKAVDAPIQLVPMIDLLVSCIAFLLITAVWVHSGTLQADQSRDGPPPDPGSVASQDLFKVQIAPEGLRVGLNQTDMQDIPHDAARWEALRRSLVAHQQVNPQNNEVFLQPDSVVDYNEILRVMDIVYEVFHSTPDHQVDIRFL